MTPLEQIQADAAAVFVPLATDQEGARAALDAFLVRAFDAGILAVQELQRQTDRLATNEESFLDFAERWKRKHGIGS